MRLKYILLYIPLFFLFACSNQTGKQGEVPSKNNKAGDQTQATSKTTLNDEVAFRLEPLMQLNAEQDLVSAASIAQHPRGMLIADYGGRRILCFDKNDGSKLFEFGRQGDGPGELQRPLRVSCSDDEIFVYDLGRLALITYSLEGEFHSEEKETRAAAHAIFSNDQIYFGYFHREGLPDIIIRKRDGSLEREITLKGSDKNTYYATMAVDKDGFLYAAALNKYSVEVYDPKGNFVRSFQRPFDALPFIPLEKFQLNIGIIPVSAITFNEDYVFLMYGGHQTIYENFSGTTLGEEYSMRIDVFDKKGNYLTYFWHDDLPKHMAQVHNVPIFLLDDNNRFWIQDPQDFSTIHVMELKKL